jgi:HEAT repeat protein
MEEKLMHRRIRGALFCALLCVPLSLSADDAADAVERTRKAILFGIDSQVLEIVQKLKTSGDSSFTPELAALLQGSRVHGVRKAILDLFSEQKVKEGEPAAREILAGWQDAKSDLLAQAILYLDGLGATDLAEPCVQMIANTDSAVSSAAIRAVGKSKDPKFVKTFLDKLDDADFPDARKPEIILALGDLGSTEAVERLLKLVGSKDTQKIWRMYAADSLGRLGDPKALPVLKGLFDEDDALLKAYAATALAHFDLADVLDILVQCLREENWKVRVQAAKALAQPGAGKALQILSYKAEYDPTQQVKTEAIRAVAEIEGLDAETFLSNLLRNGKAPLESREYALRGLWKRNPARATDDAKTVLADKTVGLDLKPSQMVGRVLSQVDGNALDGIYAAFLDASDPILRSYGVRGVLRNKVEGLKERVRTLSTADASSAVRAEALRCIQKLGW